METINIPRGKHCKHGAAQLGQPRSYSQDDDLTIGEIEEDTGLS